MSIERRIPIATQVSSIISGRIHGQEYLAGSRLPSESDLAQELGVSRATVRSALGRLAAEGLVIRKQGDGTYVNAHIDSVPTRMGGIWNFLRLIEYSGYQASIRAIAQAVRAATEPEVSALRLTDGEQVLAMTRLFCADGNPVILSYGAAPIRLLVEPAEQCNAELSLDDFIQRYYRRQISYTIFDIHTTMPGETLRNVLQLESGEPVLVLDQTFYDAANQPIFYSRGYFQDKIVRLRLVQAWK